MGLAAALLPVPQRADAHTQEAREGLLRKTQPLPADELAHRACALYETFRPEVPVGTRGWGAIGVLDLTRVRNADR